MRSRFPRILKLLTWTGGILAIGFIGMLPNVYRHGGIESVQQAEVIVVLGAAQWNGEPSPVFQNRLDRANELYRAGYAPLIIVTGGRGETAEISDSMVGKKYLVKHGITDEAVLIEEQSKTTLQNLANAKTLLSEGIPHSILLVSNDFHMMRAKKMARDMGFAVSASPVETKDNLKELEYSLREVVVYAAYLLFRI